MDLHKETDVRVNDESVEAIYNNYTSEMYLINRRYQRKLVWSTEEKEKLINSICNKLPIPLVLVAKSNTTGNYYEIIDGLQRINAIISFIENEYSYDGKYFNLDLFSATVLKKKSGEITQKNPVLDEEVCKAILKYRIPVSTYSVADPANIDEVFSRINSSGKKLSRQEVRQAGATHSFSELIRKISAEIRGDVTYSDKLKLVEASRISISDDKNDSNGVFSGDIFWVNNGVLNDKEVCTESRDEEYVLDLLMDVLCYPEYVATGSTNRTLAYKEPGSNSNERIPKLINSSLRRIGKEEVKKRFMTIFDIVNIACEKSGKTFVDLVLPGRRKSSRGVPRYYQVIFLTLYIIIYTGTVRKESVDYDKLISGFDNIFESVKVQTRGGTFEIGVKENAVKSLIGHLENAFDIDSDCSKQEHMHTTFENKLKIAVIEDSMFELKQGFTMLNSNDLKVNNNIVPKIVRTATAMSNMRSEGNGYIYFGVADDFNDVEQIKNNYDIIHQDVHGFHIVGVNHELEHLKMSPDDMQRWILDKISKTNVEPSIFKDRLKSNVHLFRYNDYLIYGIEVPNFDEPVYFDEKLFYREGNSTREAHPRMSVEIGKKFS